MSQNRLNTVIFIAFILAILEHFIVKDLENRPKMVTRITRLDTLKDWGFSIGNKGNDRIDTSIHIISTNRVYGTKRY